MPARPLTLPSPADQPELSIVVMFTHDPALAGLCLGGIAAIASELPAAETILVLNAASDQVRELVLERTEGARVIESPVNTGTAVAWQLAFTAARGRRVLLMHEDAVPLPGMLPKLWEGLDAEPAAAAIGPWLDEGERKGVNAGWLRFRSMHGTRLTPELLPPGLADGVYAVDEISTAISLWNREAWAEIGGFEERLYPAMGLEGDSFTNLWSRGRSVLVEPSARGRHRSGAMDSAPGLLSGPHLRNYLATRFETLWHDKWLGIADWMTDLPEHIDPTQPLPSELIALGLERAQSRRRELPTIGDPPVSSHGLTNPEAADPPPVTVDASIAERLRAAERAAIDGYTRWLIARDAELSARYDEVYAAYNELSERAEREHNQLAAILNGRWWRLRGLLRRD